MVLPSGDQRGVARRPFALVSFLAGPPEALTTYNWRWPGFTASERNAICWLSGDQSRLPSARARFSAAAVTRFGAALDSRSATYIAVLPSGAPSLPMRVSTQAT